MRRLGVAILGIIALTIPAAAATESEQPPDRAAVTLVSASFQPYTPDARAITHDPRVPPGAHAKVIALTAPTGTLVTLITNDLLPNREYGAHVHTRPCGPAPADSGLHYQHIPDPLQPSTNPTYANPHNEIWLDFTTDTNGDATAVSKVDWTFTDRRANSVIIHEHHTHSGEGHAGIAGARLACVTAAF